MYRIIFLAIALVFLASLAACSNSPETATAPNCSAGGDTPTAAYKRLYSAVKSKNTDAIKAEMTTNTLQFAEGVSAKNNTPINKVFENGFTGSTFSPAMPDMRDERVNCNMGSLEVWNPQAQVWDDLPFVIENGQWRLAIGDLFKGTFKSPGKGLAIREAEAANAARGNTMPPVASGNANTNNPERVAPTVNSSNRNNSSSAK